MLRRSLLSLIPLIATILINVGVAGFLLTQLSGAARSQLSELPFQASVRRLSDHAERLTVQIQAAFVAGTPERIDRVAEEAQAALRGLDREASLLRADRSGLLDRQDGAGPEARPLRAVLADLDRMRDDLAATVERATRLAREDLQVQQTLTSLREGLSKATRAAQPACAADAKASAALLRGVMAVLYAQDQITVMNIAGPQFRKGIDGLRAKLAADAPERSALDELERAFQPTYDAARQAIGSRLNAQVLVDHGRDIDLTALNRLLEAASQAVDERSHLIASGSERAVHLTVAAAAIGLAVGTLVAAVLAWRTARTLMGCVGDLRIRADGMSDVSSQLAESSPRLSGAAENQAAAVKESSAALHELSALSQHAAQEARQADAVARDALQRATRGSASALAAADRLGASLERLTQAMDGIARSSSEAAQVIVSIDDLAYQTNLIALNASIEAAHAGDLGAGFAVVADEVRVLAQRSSNEARANGELMEQNRVRMEEVARIAAETRHELRSYLAEELPAVFGGLESGAAEVVRRMTRLAESATQQAGSVEEISTAVGEIDKEIQASVGEAAGLSTASRHLAEVNEQVLETLVQLERIAGRRPSR